MQSKFDQIVVTVNLLNFSDDNSTTMNILKRLEFDEKISKSYIRIRYSLLFFAKTI